MEYNYSIFQVGEVCRVSFLWLLLPLLFCGLRLLTHQYIYSALISLSCAFVVAVAGTGGRAWLVALALAVSAGGDWFMAHQNLGPNNFLFGVGGFAVAHLLLIAFAARRFGFALPALAATLCLGALYYVYLRRRIFPGLDGFTAKALAGYACVSLLGLFFALSQRTPALEKWLYAAGIVCILFSDTMIAEADFAHAQWARPWILPTYYLCHLLLAASQTVR